MNWVDIKAGLTKVSVRKKERLALASSIESAWRTGGTDHVEAWLRQKINGTITRAETLRSELVGSRGAQGEEDIDEHED